MVHWDGYVVSFYSTGIKLHVLPESDNELVDAKEIDFVQMPDAYPPDEVVLLDMQSPADNELSLLVAVQEKSSFIGFWRITCNPLGKGSKLRILKQSQIGPREGESQYQPVVRYCVGTTKKRLFHIVMPATQLAFMMTLYTVPICASASTIDKYCIYKPRVSLSRIGLPLPALYTTVDYDDGLGILAIGTSTGDLCIGSFLQHNVLTDNSINTNLPSTSSSYQTKRLSEVRLLSYSYIPGSKTISVSIRARHSNVLQSSRVTH